MTQAQVDKLTRELIVKLAELGELDSRLQQDRGGKPRQRKARGQTSLKATGQTPLYLYQCDDPALANHAFGTQNFLPKECDSNEYCELIECCPDCSEVVIKGAMGRPNRPPTPVLSKNVLRGISVTTQAFAERFDYEDSKQEQQ